MNQRVRLICPTPSSLPLASALQSKGWDIEVWERPKSIREGLETALAEGIPVIGICAIGILVRLLADTSLPAKKTGGVVLAAAEDGSAVIPLLGGHEGANQLAALLAAAWQGKAIITTASDQVFGIALDMPPTGWTLHDPDRQFSKFMQALLEVGEADLSHAPDWVQSSDIPHKAGARLKILWQLGPKTPSTANELVYAPNGRLAVGLGCERNCPVSFVEELIQKAENDLGVSLSDAAYASINLKVDEHAFQQVAPRMRFFTAEQLAPVPVPNPSDVVRAEVGTASVSEASALLLAGSDSELVYPKIKNSKATLAIALAPEPIDMTIGTSRPNLKIIGLGPGATNLVSPQALASLEAADIWVGYSLYMDQAEGILGQTKPRLDFNLGDEEARCRAALDEAAKGQRVALICSGDPQVYAMAQVVYELLARHADNEGWQRIAVETLPGITAMSALAAKVGAPMGHDFCAISLSDLNTPWEVIEKKVQAAAEADFVVGFYNPRSKKRDWQLPRALEILKQHRPDDCPVAFGRNVSRPDEAITRTTLGDLSPEDIDMFTCLIVGASFTQRHQSKTGDFIFTPRGYKLS